jgi:acyl-CoA synthetase (AMP-forming)/AMP-acid ligase II
VKDEDGYVHLVDRSKDLIITGGYNVFPGEIEQVIWTHPSVQDCAVIGVPDDKWGEAVTAVVELKPGLSIAADEVIAMCKDRLGSIKAPKNVVVWPQLPRSNVGKVLKKDIRAHYWKDRQRAI